MYVSEAALAWHEPGWLDNWGGEWVGPDAYRVREGGRRYEMYEMSFASKAGLGVAAEEAGEALRLGSWDRIRDLAVLLREELGRVPGVEVQASDGADCQGAVPRTTLALVRTAGSSCF